MRDQAILGLSRAATISTYRSAKPARPSRHRSERHRSNRAHDPETGSSYTPHQFDADSGETFRLAYARPSVVPHWRPT